MAESKTSKRRIKAAERQARALELRASGATFEEIRLELGYRSRAGAFKAVSAALDKTLRPPADEVRQLELRRLDKLLDGIWKSATDRGNLKAIGAVLRIMERRARLCGLDKPSKIEVQNFLHGAEWSRIKDAVQRALVDHPEAAQAVAEALQELDE